MGRKPPRPLNRADDRPLSSMPDRRLNTPISIERVLQRAGIQEVILLRIKSLPPLDSITSPLQPLVFGSPAEYRGPSFILQENNAWSKAGQKPTAEFNCHAYALGKRIGLTAEDWVEGEPTNLSEDTNPMEILLSVYFRRIMALSVSQIDSLSQAKEGDIISFTLERLYGGTTHLHSGRIKVVNGQNWMASKFRTGRLLVTPIEEALRVYPTTQKICIYRFRNR